MEEFDAAVTYINEAIKLAQNYPKMYETGVYHANRGLIYFRKGLVEAARRSCSMAQGMATKSKSVDGLEQAKYCLDQINGV